jgi:hypothetical protein
MNQTQHFNDSFLTCISQSESSAVKLVNMVVEKFACFRDETSFAGKTIHFYKRAQILVADLWACFEGKGYGKFDDINKITMFAGMYGLGERSSSRNSCQV